MSLWVTLTDQQIKYADEIGERRHIWAIRTGAIHKNNRSRNADADLQNDISAARCEFAAHLMLGTRKWDCDADPVRGNKKPDLDGWIDVKERHVSFHHLIVQLDDPPHFAYVSVCSQQHPDYFCDGWCWGTDIQFERFIKSLVPGRPAYAARMIDPIIKSPHELLNLVSERLCL